MPDPFFLGVFSELEARRSRTVSSGVDQLLVGNNVTLEATLRQIVEIDRSRGTSHPGFTALLDPLLSVRGLLVFVVLAHPSIAIVDLDPLPAGSVA